MAAAIAQADSRAEAGRWKPWRRKLKFTREGWYFVGVTLGVGLAAVNTGNNLLYLVLGLQLSLIIVSGILSERTLRDLSISRRLPTRAEAGRTFLVEISLANRKRWSPSYSVEVEDLLAGRATEKRCYFLKVAARGVQTAAYRCTLPRRGQYRFRGFRLSTRFPFGLFEKWREIEGVDDFLVLPRLRPVRPPLPGSPRAVGDRSLSVPGPGEEYYGLRAFRPGDDSRDIHWKTSARRDELLVREHEAERGREVIIALDNAIPTGLETDPATEAAMEDVVSLAASLATEYARRGLVVTMAARGELRPSVSGDAGLTTLLRWLALLSLPRHEDAPAIPWPLPADAVGVGHRRAQGLPETNISMRIG